MEKEKGKKEYKRKKKRNIERIRSTFASMNLICSTHRRHPPTPTFNYLLVFIHNQHLHYQSS